MLALVQRVNKASVHVEDELVGSIGTGLCVLLCVMAGDGEEQARWMAGKLARLRIFSNEDGQFDLSVQDVEGSILLVSQFTLAGDCRKGNRPSFTEAADPDTARELLENLAAELDREHGIHVEQGRFQAAMRVDLENDGPVTVMVTTPQRDT